MKSTKFNNFTDIFAQCFISWSDDIEIKNTALLAEPEWRKARFDRV